MEYPTPTVVKDGTPYEIISYEEFRTRRGLPMMANQTITYNIENDRLDFTIVGGHRLLVWNHKAQEFTLNIRRPYKTPTTA